MLLDLTPFHPPAGERSGGFSLGRAGIPEELQCAQAQGGRAAGHCLTPQWPGQLGSWDFTDSSFCPWSQCISCLIRPSQQLLRTSTPQKSRPGVQNLAQSHTPEE